MEQKKKISLYLVATPIGNLNDVSPRALETLEKADFIAAEDTRVSGKLLAHFGIKKPLISYYEHNIRQRGEVILERLRQGEVCALVSDAGMPAISDPGEMIVKQCMDEGFAVSAVPGPCAMVCALAMSGLSTKRFAFEGFFSLVEQGEWDVSSNNSLMNMYVFPDNAKTWIIGDGYFDGPSNTDPYYVGPTMTGFYMWTDVGYLRFIFYFGLIGLGAFMAFFYKCGQTCATKFSGYSVMFWIILLLNYIIWFKVSTDIFLVFALFLCISKEDNDAYENSLSDPLDI